MRLRVAKGITLARKCGNCRHNWHQIQIASVIVFRAMRRGSRLVNARLPEVEDWSGEDRRAAGVEPR